MRNLMIASLLTVSLLMVGTAAFAGDCGACGTSADKTYVGWSGWHDYDKGCGDPCTYPCYDMCKKPKCSPCKPKCKPCCEQVTCTPPPCDEPEKCCPAPVCEYPNACEGADGEFDRNGISRQDA